MEFVKDSPTLSIGIALTSFEEIMSIANELCCTHHFGLDVLIINCSVTNGIVPNGLKVAKEANSLESGQRNKLISVLPYFYKFFEKVLYQGLTTYFGVRNSLSMNKCGFRFWQSTFMALLELY